MAVPAAVLSVLVQANTGGATRGLMRFNQQLGGTEAQSNKATRALGTFAKVGVIGAGIGLGYAVKKAADFEQQLDSLGSVSGATGREMEKFRKQAMKAGADTKFSALDAAEAQTELAKGGLRVRQIMRGGLKSALALAAAGEMDLAEAASTTANALNLFGLEGKNSMKVADALAKAANATTADVTDFAMALRQSGGVAKTAGLSFTETVLALESLANAGTKNSDAGTSLKTALIQLIKPTKVQAGLAKELNLEFIDGEGNFKKMGDVAKMLRDRLGDLTATRRAEVLATLAGTDGVRTLTALYDAGPKKLDKWKKGLNESGTAAEVAARKQSNLKGKLENLQGSIETIAIAVGSKLIPQLTKYAEKLTDVLNNTKLSGSEKVGKVAELLAEAIGKGIASAGAAAIKAAPHMAWAFVKAFMEADAWGKLAIGGAGAFLLKKLGVGAGIGKLLGKGGAGGLTGGVLKSTKPVPVFVTNPGSIGGKGGPGGGAIKGAAATTALQAAARAVPLVAAGSVIAYIAMKNNRNLPTGSGSGPGNQAKPISDSAKGRPAIVAPKDAFKREIGTQIVKSKGMKDEGAAAAAAGMEQLAKRVKQARKEIAAMREGAGGDINKLAANAKRQFQNIEDNIGLHTRKGRKIAGDNFEAVATAIGRSMAKGRTSSKKGMSAIEDLMRTHSRTGKERLTQNLIQAANNIKRSMREGEIATGKGTRAIEALMVKALQNMGFTKKQALRVRQGNDPASNRPIDSAAPGQTGGHLVPGQGDGDRPFGFLPTGSFVLNKKATEAFGLNRGGKVPVALEPGERYFLPNEVKKHGVDRLFAMNAAVPRFQGGGMVRVPGDPDTTGGRDLVAASIAQQVASWIKRYKIQIGYAYDPGGGHRSAGHNVTGTALDVVPGIGGSWDTLEAGLKAAVAAGKTVYYGTNGIGTPLEDHGRGLHGHVEWGGSGGVGGSVPGIELAKKLKRLMVEGPDSLLKANVQGAIDRTRAGANEVIERANKMATDAQQGSFAGKDLAGFTGGGNAAENRALGLRMAKAVGWGGANWRALDRLWQGESGWDESIPNAEGSGAFGIPQALPASKMASAGADWRTNPATQIKWGLNYIKERYGNPIKAYQFWLSQSPHWYSKGGMVEALQKGGVVGMQKGGSVGDAKSRWGQSINRKEMPSFLKAIWAQARGLGFEGSPPKFVPGGAGKHSYANWGKGGKNVVHTSKAMMKALGNVQSRDHSYALQTVLHEMAHSQQLGGLSKREAEGGADLWAGWAANKIFPALGIDPYAGGPTQYGYPAEANWVAKNKPERWWQKGQFGLQKGGPVAKMAKGGSVSYPLASKGNVIGTPYAGTHSLGNWQSDNAVDIGTSMGTLVKAVTAGKIGGIKGGWGGGSSRFDGYQVYLDNPNTQWWYTHLKSVNAKSGQGVTAGQGIGSSGAANGVPHIHLGRKNGTPMQALKWPILSGAGGNGKPGPDPAKKGKATGPHPIGKLAYVGDSLGVGTLGAGLKKKLGKIGLASNAVVGKPSPWGVDAIKPLLAGAGAGMLDMGTNDGTVSNLRPSISAVKGMLKGRPLIMSSLDPQSTDVAKKNAAIRSMADVVVPWAGQAQKFASDAVHPTGAGYTKRANMIAEAVKALRTKGEATGKDPLPKALTKTLKQGPIGKAFKKTLKFLRKTGNKKLRAKALRGFERRIKKVSGSIPEGLQKQISALTEDAAIYDEFAGRASSLTGDEEGSPLGVVGGKTEGEWLQAELAKLFLLRNKLIEAQEVIEKRRKQVADLLERARERLIKIKDRIEENQKQAKKVKKHLDQMQKHPKQHRAEIKKAKNQLDNLEQNTKGLRNEQSGLKDSIIPALRGKRTGLTAAIGELSDPLTTVQGLGAPMGKLKSLPAVGVLGGSIFDVQMRLQDLAAPATAITDGSSAEPSESVELLQQLLREANLRTAVSQKQYEVFKNFPAYGGEFATGGVVPGPIGAARTIVAHGGETVTPPGNGGGNVQVIVGPGMEWLEKFIEVRVDGVTRKQARGAGRRLPGRGGGI